MSNEPQNRELHAGQNAEIKIDKVGFDSFLDDLFGMNIKGLKTIWALLVRPADYFKAAKTPEWMNRYTPSFRVWFGITALTAAMKFLWAGEGSAMLELYTQQMQMIADEVAVQAEPNGKYFDMSAFDAKASANYLLKYTFLISPFALIFLMGLLAWVYRAWGEKLSYIVRLRYCFAIIITGSAFGFVTAFLGKVFTGPVFATLTWAMLAIMFGLYFFTAYKGAYAHFPRGKRIGYSSAITALSILVVMVSTFMAIILALFPTIANTFPRSMPLSEKPAIEAPVDPTASSQPSPEGRS